MPSAATREWLTKASEDEQVVSALKHSNGPWSMAAYHVQQAAEKYIKAALVEKGVAPPKSHDLVQLLGLLPTSPGQSVESAAAKLSPYAWITRYPGAPPVTESEFLQAEADLQTIVRWAIAATP